MRSAAQRRQQPHQTSNPRVGARCIVGTEPGDQGLGPLRCRTQSVAREGEDLPCPFFVTGQMQAKAAHDLVTLDGSPYVLEVQQQPELEARHRGDRLEAHGLPVVIAQLAVERVGQLQGVEIAGVVVPVEHGIDLLEGTRLDLLVPIPALEQGPGVLHHLDRRRPEFAGMHLDVGRVQPVAVRISLK